MSRNPYLIGACLILLAAAPAVRAANICLQTNAIESTEIKDDSTILFHMRDGTTYRNSLPQRCYGLKSASNGFTYAPTDPGSDELCGNFGTFRVNESPAEGFGTGPVCMWGPFTKLPPTPHR